MGRYNTRMASERDKAAHSVAKAILIVIAIVAFATVFAIGTVRKFRPVFDVSKENDKRNQVIDELVAP